MNKILFYYPDHYCLNNLSAHEVRYQRVTYKTVEHAYQSQKFHDKKIAKLIQLAKSPLGAKAIAHKNTKLMRADWETIKIKTMRDIARAKINQHPEVLKVLLSTLNKEIVENSPDDYFWGIGKKQTGRNQMGKILMELRKELILKKRGLSN